MLPSNLLSPDFIRDFSSNNISGAIPYSLPLNVTSLNLSHNSLSGALEDVFNGLENLKQLDLSFNNFTGDLPISFKYLTNLTSLFLQSNQFTGSVVFLANLSLTDLYVYSIEALRK
ncbi:hypothetical protein ACS0TY_012857 [Phlomoides rotata]